MVRRWDIAVLVRVAYIRTGLQFTHIEKTLNQLSKKTSPGDANWDHTPNPHSHNLWGRPWALLRARQENAGSFTTSVGHRNSR